MAMQLMRKNVFFILTIILAFYFSSSYLYANTSKVNNILILPFSFNADNNNDLSFLRKGIDRMLHTRLTHINKTKVIFDNSGESPITAGRKLSADYVLSGSITMYGQKVSTDAILFSIKENKEVLNFGAFGETKGDAIGHINDLATKINIEVLGIETSPSVAQYRTQPIQNQQGLYQAMPQYGSGQSFKFQSRPMNLLIKSLAIGDVNGDKKNEIIFITQTSLNIITFQNKKEIPVAQTQLSGFSTPIRVDAIDIDNDNRDEIIISSVDDKKLHNKSVAFKYDNGTKTLKKISIYPNAFYTTYLDLDNKILIGQRRSDGLKNYKGNFFKAEFIDGSIALSETTIHKPMNSNIYTFTAGDLFNNKSVIYPIYDEDGYVTILSDSNTETWRTSDKFGSTPVSFLRGDPGVKLRDEEDKFYIWQRMHIADLNNDQKNDLILVENQLSSSEFFDRTRTYRSGSIQILSWDEETDTLKKAWESRQHSGYIVDCIIGDMNNDGKDEIIYAVIPKSKNLVSFMRKHVSHIFAKGF